MNILLDLRLIVIAIMCTFGVMACAFVNGGGVQVVQGVASGGVTGTGISYATVGARGEFVNGVKHNARVPNKVLDARSSVSSDWRTGDLVEHSLLTSRAGSISRGQLALILGLKSWKESRQALPGLRDKAVQIASK